MFARPKPPVRMLPKYWRSMADSQSRHCARSAFFAGGGGYDAHGIAASPLAFVPNLSGVPHANCGVIPPLPPTLSREGRGRKNNAPVFPLVGGRKNNAPVFPSPFVGEG